MLKDVIALSKLQKTGKVPSKETLNHKELIHLASGIDPMQDTKNSYLDAYESLGIDIINRIPEENTPLPLNPGECVELDNGYSMSYLGLYNTYCRNKYPFKNENEFFDADDIDLNYNKLITPVPHSLNKNDIEKKMKIAGDIGLYYYMLYTTLFMWGVEYLGWEVFMTAATLEPEIFKRKFLDKAFEQSKKLIKILSDVDSPFVFVHDDLASAIGPVFSPEWYETYIFPKYNELWNIVHNAGKKVIFTADGNMQRFLQPLRDSGVDGVMLENPSTDFDKIIENFGDRIIIGGIDTKILTFGTAEEIKKHVLSVYKKTRDLGGYAMSTSGGIHGNIPLKNLEMYFDTRVDIGCTLKGWRRK